MLGITLSPGREYGRELLTLHDLDLALHIVGNIIVPDVLLLHHSKRHQSAPQAVRRQPHLRDSGCETRTHAHTNTIGAEPRMAERKKPVPGDGYVGGQGIEIFSQVEGYGVLDPRPPSGLHVVYYSLGYPSKVPLHTRQLMPLLWW